MAEGGPGALRERGRNLEVGLAVFKKAVATLKEIGLTHESAIIQAGKMLELDLKPDDIAPQKSAGRKTARRKKRR